jgi:uncharacterized protein with FMN-binding domain
MKKTIIIFAVAILMSAASCSDPNMHKNSDGSYTVVTTELCKDIRGINLSEIPSVDAVSGATFTSRALRKNLEAAAEYYEGRK